MKLTDEKIEQEIDGNYALEKLQQPNCLELNRFRFGARFARDFYENQKCRTCAKPTDEKFPDGHIYCFFLGNYFPDDFSCGGWEEK